jgi:site-specific recombinase XerD
VGYYQMCLSGLEWFAHKEHWPDPEGITRDHIRDFMDYVSSEPHRWAGDGRRCTFKRASVGTVHHYGKVVKTFFNWAQDEEYLSKSPTLRMRLPRPHYKEVEPYSDDEVSAMLSVCEHDIEHGYRYLGIRNKAIISVFIDTGLRLSELAQMRLSQLDPNLRQVRVMGKGAKLRVVPLDGEARKALKRYLTQARPPGGDSVWLTDDGGPLSPCSIKIMINRLQRRAGVVSGGGAHRFRHYFATRCLENGMDLNSLRLLLGHATLYMVLRYTKFQNVQRALAEHPKFSPLDRLYRGGNHNRGDDSWGWRH